MLLVARGILKNPNDAEDAVQNALFRLSKNIDRIPEENPTVLRAYVLTAAKYAALDMLPLKSTSIDIDEVTVVASDDLFTQVTASEDYDRLISAINDLPQHYREVLMLRYVHEMSVKEISKVLHRRQGTIRKQIERARSRLLQAYQE